MTRKTSTFTDFDPLKVWAGFDPLQASDQFTKMFGDMAMPQINMDAFMTSQRKSMEALNVANQKALDGFRAVSERQAKIVRDAVEKASAAMEDFGKTKNPQEIVEKQAALAKKAYDKSVKDLTELSELVVKTNTDAIEPINARIQESFDELKTISKANGK